MTITGSTSPVEALDCYMVCIAHLQNYITVLEQMEDIPEAAQADGVKTDDNASGCQASPTGTSVVVKEVRLVSVGEGGDHSNGTVTPCLLQTASKQSISREVRSNSIDERLDTASGDEIHSVKSQVTFSTSLVRYVTAPCIHK